MPNREKPDHVVFRTTRRPNGTKGIEVFTPEGVVPIYNREELLHQLKHYSQELMSLHTPDSVTARRHYVELIRPALRYYCKKFHVDPPKWLASDEYYTKHMPAKERTDHFGLKPLRIAEFQKLRKVPNTTPPPGAGGDDADGE